MTEKTIGELGIQLHNIDSNLEKHIETNTETHRILFTELKETNGRVSGLEKWRFIAMGGLMVLSAIVVPVLLMIIRESIK